MSEPTWKWWVGHNEEVYTTQCDTREQAVEIAETQFEGGYICEAMMPDNIQLAGFFDVDSFLEGAEDTAYDDHCHPDTGSPIFDLNTDQKTELNITVKEAIRHWQERREIVFKGTLFSAQRNEEYIPARDIEPAQEKRQ
jgi:hypothetical protein